jgi:hypothetical protein
MDYEVKSADIADSGHGSSYGFSEAAGLLEETVEAHLEVARDVETSMTSLARGERDTIGAARVSYGIADILFPMTPPKPKGARLIRGPLRFN